MAVFWKMSSIEHFRAVDRGTISTKTVGVLQQVAAQAVSMSRILTRQFVRRLLLLTTGVEAWKWRETSMRH